MKSFGLSRYALAMGATSALLTGCGGSQPPIGAPGAQQNKVKSLPLNFRAVLAAVGIALCSTSSANGQVADALTGKMRWWQQVAGTWQCTLHLHPAAGQTEGYGPIRMTATPTQGNTLHVHSDLIGVHGDDYIGYSKTTKVWWDAGVDNGGHATLSTSTDNVVYTQVSDSTGSVEKDRNVFRVIVVLQNGILVSGRNCELRTYGFLQARNFAIGYASSVSWRSRRSARWARCRKPRQPRRTPRAASRDAA